MATDPRFQTTDPRFNADYQSDEPAKKRSGWQTCMIGCLVVLAIMVVIGILVGLWVARNWREWSADIASQVVEQGLEETDLPAQEKQDIRAQVDRVTDAFRDGRLSLEQLGKIMERLANSPLMPAFMVFAVEKQYFEQSGLSADEKEQGRQTLRRFLRGTIDKKIDEQGMDKVLAYIGEKKSDGQWEMKPQVTDDDLRAALAEAKKQADDANIGDEPEDFDPSDEIKKVIDAEMGEVQVELPPVPMP